MKTESKLITEEVAKIYLASMTRNRPVVKKKVDYYSDIMRRGQWCESTHQGIAFNENGELVDGQHRLLAIINTKIPLVFNVTYGVSNDAFMTMDMGYKRTTGNVMAINGVKNYNAHSAAIQSFFALKKGLSTHNKTELFLTTEDIVEFYYQNEDLCKQILNISECCYLKRRLTSKTNIYALLLKMVVIDKKDIIICSDFFFEVFGVIQVTNKTITLLSDRLIKIGLSKMTLPKNELFALIIKTFNSYQNGVGLKTLKWDSKREEYPVIQ